uniref:3'-5' exonuclease n=1 Tax=Flavobacterium sp. TaxID=239 RepID=UPI004049C9B8
MLDWFKKTLPNYPLFWEEYLTHFQSKIPSKKFVVFDCETTGLDTDKDVILSIGAVVVEENTILIDQSFEIFIDQQFYDEKSTPIHGILKDGIEEKVVEIEAIIQFLKRIENHTLVGHHAGFDIAMVNKALKRNNLGKLKNESMDTDAMYQKFKYLQEDQHSSLDELCQKFKIPMHNRHTALGDAYLIAILFLKLKDRLNI